LVPELVRPGGQALRFVFPHAPIRPVTLNGGFAMRAWYDIIALDRHGPEDEKGIRASQATVEALIRRENARGIGSERIVLAGFSQGGALALFAGARYPDTLAGILGLSCSPPLAPWPSQPLAPWPAPPWRPVSSPARLPRPSRARSGPGARGARALRVVPWPPAARCRTWNRRAPAATRAPAPAVGAPRPRPRG